MEYLRRKFEELAESLLEPIWSWIMARSWIFRACILTLGGAIFLGVYNIKTVSEYYRVAVSTIAVALAGNDRINLSAGTKERLSSTAARLEATVNVDLTTLAGLTPWSTAQAIVAVGKKDGAARPAYAHNALALIRNHRAGGCFCWAEIPDKDADGIAVFIGGWVMLAFSNLNEMIPDTDVTNALEAQNVHGWWPIFLDKTDEAFASTYATAWMVLGLVEINRRDRISSALRERVDGAVGRAVSWLLTTRGGSVKWKPYPNMANSKESDSISGLVLHTLHMSGALGLRELDQGWLAGLPDPPPEASADEPNYTELRGAGTERIDHFTQLKLPWLLTATIDAFPGGGLLQKGRARVWIDTAVSESSVSTADANTNNWWRAELLYALKYVQSRQ